MHRFLNGTQEAWDDFSQRARRACAVFGWSLAVASFRQDASRSRQGSEFSRYITSGRQPTVKIAANPAPVCIPADYELAVPGDLAISLVAPDQEEGLFSAF